MRTRMSWDWLGNWPIFVYTTWKDNELFHVKIIKGKLGDQNAGGTGPNSPAWIEYEQRGLSSKEAVVEAAMSRAAKELANQ